MIIYYVQLSFHDVAMFVLFKLNCQSVSPPTVPWINVALKDHSGITKTFAIMVFSQTNMISYGIIENTKGVLRPG